MGTDRAVDGGGLSQSAAAGLSVEQQFDLVRERDARMQELLTGAQLQISSGVWGWGQKGGAPITGPNAWSLPGMTTDNSYYLDMWRWIRPEGAAGAKVDLEPMIEYFESQGWEFEVTENRGDYRARADTGDGYWVTWNVQENGMYNMGVMSRSYWGSGPELLSAIADRTPPEKLEIEESEPGVYIPFPDWNDPRDYAPNLLDHSGPAE